MGVTRDGVEEDVCCNDLKKEYSPLPLPWPRPGWISRRQEWAADGFDVGPMFVESMLVEGVTGIVLMDEVD